MKLSEVDLDEMNVMQTRNEQMNDCPERVKLFGVGIDPVDMPAAIARLQVWIEEPQGKCRYVVTPNVDHVVMLQESEKLREVYGDADLVTADGMPVVVASRWLGHPLPARVTGADLVPALFTAAKSERPLRVFLLGAAPGVAERAAKRIEDQWPGVRVVGMYSPPIGFEKDAAENRHILAEVAAVHPDLLVVGLGAPKQEFWVHAHRDRIVAKVALCVGATIDFLAGEKPRAPSWMGKLGVEWLHRLCTEPRRLFKRYAHDAYVFPQLVWREWRAEHARRCGA